MSDPGWARVATLRDRRGVPPPPRGGRDSTRVRRDARPAGAPFAKPLEADGLRVGNRFCVLPMEGWDGTPDGRADRADAAPLAHFGRSGAKLIWGGEAVAVRHDGRANPQPARDRRRDAGRRSPRLREALVAAHEELGGKGAADDLLVGLQLTHSGRFSRPNARDRAEPLVAYHHPLLDRRFPRRRAPC